MSITRSILSIDKVGVRRGADVLLEVLRSEGVEYIFGNPGTTELPLMDALLDAPEIQYILALQEASAVAMADGYAQAARKPGFLNLHTAGGLGHGMGNLLNASVSQTPLVVTAGQQDTRHTITDPLLFGDLVSLATPAVKWAQEVVTADQLPILVRRAFNDSTAAPAGPVFLSLPMNVMEEMTAVDAGETSCVDHTPTAGSLDLLASALAAVPPGRLAIIAGDEVHWSRAANEVLAVAEIFGAPVYGSSWPSRVPVPTSHELWAGHLPTRATEIARTLSPYSAVFALGGKSLITILYSEDSALPSGCRAYQLSADVRDLGRTYSTPLSVMGDIRKSLAAFIPIVQELLTPSDIAAYAAVRQQAKEKQLRRRAERNQQALAEFDAPGITPLVAAQQVVRAIGPKIPIVDEAIVTSAHVRSLLDSDWPEQYSFLRGGALGWGMPAAVGCSLGSGREPVVSLVGDGAALYSPQAMWTAAHENLPVTFIVMNNREYNVLKNFMKSRTDYRSTQLHRYIAMDLDQPPIDYLALAHSMGLTARRITKANDIARAVEVGIASGTANLIEIMIRR